MKSPLSRFFVFVTCVLSLGCFAPRLEAAPLSAPTPQFSDVLHALGGETLPAAWAGIWEFTDTDRDCITNDSLSTDSSVDTLCTSDTFDPDDTGYSLDCTGTATDTEVHVVCTGSFPVKEVPGCIITVTFTLDATRSGETLESTTEFSQVYSPECGPFPGSCFRTVSTATRIGPEPAECATAVDSMTWGRVKAAYR